MPYAMLFVDHAEVFQSAGKFLILNMFFLTCGFLGIGKML